MLSLCSAAFLSYELFKLAKNNLSYRRNIKIKIKKFRLAGRDLKRDSCINAFIVGVCKIAAVRKYGIESKWVVLIDFSSISVLCFVLTEDVCVWLFPCNIRCL